MKIALMGTPVTSGNRGVLALGASLVGLCSSAAPGSEIVLLLGKRDNQPAPFRVAGEVRQVPVVNLRMSPRSAPNDHLFWILAMSLLYRLIPTAGIRKMIAKSTPWIKTVVEADIVGDIHGGDSFSDIYGIKGLLLTFMMDWSVVLVKGSLVQFPQTYGPFNSPVARWIARTLLKRSSVIIARDRKSQEIARDLAGSEKDVLLCPDVAFSLASVRPEHIEFQPPLSSRGLANVIGLNVNGLMYNGGYTRSNMFGLTLDYAALLPALVTALLRESSGDIWLVPHTFAPAGNVESDPEASGKVHAALPVELRSRVRIVARDYDQYEIKGIIGQCDFFIGSRMHACIAALSQGIPCVGIAYSMKFAGVFETVGVEEWVIDGRNARNEQAIARVLDLYHQRSNCRETLKQNGDKARLRLQEVFGGIVADPRARTR